MFAIIKFLCLGLLLLNAAAAVPAATLDPTVEEFPLQTVDLATLPHDADSATGPSRIVGGTAASINQYPFAAHIMYGNNLLGGGTILSLRHVLSAGHIFYEQTSPNVYVAVSVSNLRVRAGTTNLNSGGTSVRVSRVVVHGSYNSVTRDNDIAVVVLSSSLSYSLNVAAAFIPVQGSLVPDNVTVTHVGWGTVNPNLGQASQTLQQVNVQTIANSICAARYAQLQASTNVAYPITQNMMCTGILDFGGRDACHGDNGGPVVYNNVVVGVTSWRQGCALASYPGVSVRVASYTNWISSTMNAYSSSSALGSASSLLLISVFMSLLFNKTG